jgi:hypothetical protein
MPNTTTIAPVPPLDAYGVPLYQPNDPYHFDFDNKPIKTLAMRDQILAGQINQNTQTLRDSAGNSGSLPSRLDKSIDRDGNLKKEAVDQSMHNIAFHSDGTRNVTQREMDEYNSLGYLLNSQPEFVVMLRAERDKLSQITADANNITFKFPGITNPVDDGTIEFQDSYGIYWEISNPGNRNIVVKPILKNATDHKHFYEVTPVLINGQYKISGIQSFKKDTLRVYVNGIRIPSCSQSCSYSDGVYFPSFDTATTTQPPQLKSPNSLWKNLYFTEINEEAKFTLSSTISNYDRIFVDYEIEVIQSAPTTTLAPTTTTTTTTTTSSPFGPENIFVSDSTGNYGSLTNATMSNKRMDVISDGDPYPALAGNPLVNNGSSSRTFPGSSNNIIDQAYNFLFTYRGGLNTNNPQDTASGSMGVAVNGVVLLNPSAGTGSLPGGTDLPSTGYHFNAVLNKSLFNVDDCGASPDANGVYGYRDGSFLANCWSTSKFYSQNTYYSNSAYLGDHFRHTDGHSKILGFCFDGYPVYGPYGYTDSILSSSGVSQMLSSYITATTEKGGRSYNYDQYPAGSFIEDYDYSQADYLPNPYLDEHNGRYCVTPEYPNGTYAYFLTFASGDLNTPTYPYIFGPKTKQIREAGGAQNQGSGAYAFYINITSISNTSYALNGKDRNGNLTGNNLSINVKVGDALIFNVSSSGQPLWLKQYDITGAGSSLVGVNNNGTDNGTVAWIPNSPGVYYYISENSFNMHGSIVVVS